MRTRALPVILVAFGIGLAVLVTLAQDTSRRRGFGIAIVQPKNQEVVLGKTKIIAEVEIDDPDLVDRVEFLIGDEVIFVDREPPYECFYDFGEESRSWIVQAIAHHVEEVTASDAIISRRIPFSAVERVNRVILWVSATDNDGNFVTDLTKEDFKVMEDGKEQKILEFYREDRPITMAILVDSSGSMQDKLKEVHEAGESFVDTLEDEDKALIIDFDDNVFLIQDLTSDHEALKEAITSTEAIGGTSIYDSLHAAYRKIGTLDGRKAIVLLSDGEDTHSQFSHGRVLEEAKANDALIYAIGLGTLRKGVLKDFSDFTGGRAYFVGKAKDLAETYRRIAEELRAQFYLTYSTNNDVWDGRWIKVKVETVRPGLKARARRGYFAVRDLARKGG